MARRSDACGRGHACRTAALLLAMLALAGCATVEPWQRGTLAKPQMAIDPMPLQSGSRSHVQNTRQAAGMGSAAEGGGCGCY